MPRLILLLVLGTIAYVVYQRVSALPPPQRKKASLQIGLWVLVVVVLLATVTGRMHWLGAAITALLVGASRLLPVLIRLFPMLQWLQRRQGSATSAGGGGQQSTVETALLRMVLDHDSGDIKGEVLSGDFVGCQLDKLELSQLEELLLWCRSRDADSARLLESYLQGRFGAETDYQQTPPPEGGGNMGRAEALAVLGLPDDASNADITASHRKLMQKLHPDRGGNDYLAAKLNQAKDVLLG
ncbi:MAG: molecular chaperone DnaJ [Gammaproteobacteria bacterium]|nr:molecular chaperone DnaJ [Gammaproteobacteria bacterium]